MTEQLAFGLPPVARNTDPATSHMAAAQIDGKRPTQMILMLLAYADWSALTDEQAASRAGLSHTGYWKRCSDLRSLGLIAPTGDTAVASSGMQQQVCRLTVEGHAAITSGNMPRVRVKPATPKAGAEDQSAKLDALRRDLDAAHAAVEKAREEGHDLGWQEGYDRGAEAAVPQYQLDEARREGIELGERRERDKMAKYFTALRIEVERNGARAVTTHHARCWLNHPACMAAMIQRAVSS